MSWRIMCVATVTLGEKSTKYVLEGEALSRVDPIVRLVHAHLSKLIDRQFWQLRPAQPHVIAFGISIFKLNNNTFTTRDTFRSKQYSVWNCT